MEAIRVQQVVTKDGEIMLTGLPYKTGQSVEVILLLENTKQPLQTRLTVGQLRQSGLIGLWEGREDIQDGSDYARQLREQAHQRGDINYDFAG
ncbi:MAG: hypothetical protein AB7P14_27880 [Blastocatellales bacterium]